MWAGLVWNYQWTSLSSVFFFLLYWVEPNAVGLELAIVALQLCSLCFEPCLFGVLFLLQQWVLRWALVDPCQMLCIVSFTLLYYFEGLPPLLGKKEKMCFEPVCFQLMVYSSFAWGVYWVTFLVTHMFFLWFLVTSADEQRCLALVHIIGVTQPSTVGSWQIEVVLAFNYSIN